MQKNLIYLVLVLLLVPALAAGCVRVKQPAEKGPAVLSEAAAATSVAADGKPLNVAGTFLASTPAIYATALVSSAPENTQVGARWIYISSTGDQQLFNDSTSVYGSKYIYFSHPAPSGAWQAGQYSVVFLLDGREVSNVRFSVQAAGQKQAEAPTIEYFMAEPDSIMFGQSVNLSWKTTGASTVSISSIGAVETAGSQRVQPANSTEYTLTASNAAGKTLQKVIITVTSHSINKPELVITDFSVSGSNANYKIKNVAQGVDSATDYNVLRSRPSTTFLYIGGNYRASSRVEPLAPGEERSMTFANFEWTYGPRGNRLEVRVCADANNEVGEYDESNNCMDVNW
jgi:hypothetical protein